MPPSRAAGGDAGSGYESGGGTYGSGWGAGGGGGGAASGWTSGEEGAGGGGAGAGAGPRKPSATAAVGAGGSTTGPSGALLFSVVGGKMSEGINFSDDLARCVVVVGLPYPNAQDPELMERMKYLDRRAAAAAAAANSAGSIATTTSTLTAGREYYENVTMRAVNQAIGRSIRHAADYASIVLLDGRYTGARVKSKLPGWIGDRVNDAPTWGTVAAGVASFFRRRKQQQEAVAAAAAAGAGVGAGAGGVMMRV